MRPAALACVLLQSVLLAGCGNSGADPRLTAELKLTVLPASFAPGGSAELTLAITESPTGLRADVVAEDARGLKALYFELAYDPQQLAPVTAAASGALSATADGLVELAILDRPGTVTHGQVLANWQHREGFAGGGVVATVLFAREPHKVAAAPPDDDITSRVQLSWDGGTNRLSWRYASRGDYDQNSQVNISDLTPLGANIGASSASPPDPFPYDTALSVVDGDSNGAINISDITPIGASFGRTVAGYRVYSVPRANGVPQAAWWANAYDAVLLDFLPFGDATGAPGTRRAFEFTVPAPQATDIYYVRPADTDGVEGTPSNPVAQNGNIPPYSAISLDPSSGPIPLTVNFDASSSLDFDGTIVKYEWDWDNDGTIDEDRGTDPTAQHVYTTDGAQVSVLRITDDDGASTDNGVVIYAGDVPPFASVVADPTTGLAPLEVTFDASASSDVNGPIADYAWDFNGDTVYDLVGGGAVVTQTFTLPGTYMVTLRVRDVDLNESFAYPTVTVTAAESFHVSTLADTGDQGRYNDVAAIGGLPAVAWMDETSPAILFRRASDALATSWEPAVTVDADPAVGTPNTDGMNVALLEVAGAPAIAYYRNGGVYYTRASDATGAAWNSPPPTLLRAGSHHALQLVNGNPALAIHDFSDLLFLRADSTDGTSWLDPEVTVDSSGSTVGTNASLALVAGKPAISYTNEDDWTVRFAWSSDDNGIAGSWSSVQTSVDTPAGNNYTSLLEVNGLPAIAYPLNFPGQLRYVRAVDNTYATWEPPISPTASDFAYHGSSPSIVIYNGRPAISYWRSGGCALRFITAGNEFGTTWNAPIDIDVWDGTNCPGENTHLAIVDGRPAISYFDDALQDVKFAIWY